MRAPLRCGLLRTAAPCQTACERSSAWRPRGAFEDRCGAMLALRHWQQCCFALQRRQRAQSREPYGLLQCQECTFVEYTM